MAKNSLGEGEPWDVVAPANVVGGQAFLVGTILVVAARDASNGDVVPAYTCGLWTLPKATGEAWTIGAKLYWDDTNKRFTTTASGNTFRGCAGQAQASGDTTGLVRLNAVSI